VRGIVFTRPESSGERLLVFEQEPARWRVTLRDGKTGQSIATLTEDAWNADADFLADGRIALAEIRERDVRLRVFRADGSAERSVELGPATLALLGGEPERGRLFVGLRHLPRGDSVAIDLETGTVVPFPGLFPARRGWVGHRVLSPARPVEGSYDATLFVADSGELVRLDPDKGVRQVLLGGEAPKR